MCDIYSQQHRKLYSRHRWPPRGGPPADQRPRRRHQTHLRGNSLSASAPGNGPIHTPLQQANASCCLRRRHRRAIGLTRRSSCGSSLVPGRRCGKCSLGTRYYRFSRARWWAVTSHVLHDVVVSFHPATSTVVGCTYRRAETIRPAGPI